jgi:S-adenosylmethionine synthetase
VDGPVWSHDGMIAVGNAHKDKVKLTFSLGASPTSTQVHCCGLPKVAPHDLRRTVRGFATRQAASWNKFSSC